MEDIKNSLNQVAKGAGILLIGIILSKIINYLYRAYTARALSVSDFGLLNLGIALITFIVAVSTIGLESGLNRYIPHYRGLEDKKSIRAVIYFSTKFTLLISILMAIGIYFFSDKISILFENSKSFSSLLKILSISIPFTVVGTRICLNCLLYLKYIKEYSFIFNILQHLSRFLLTVLLLSFGFGLFGVGLAYSLSAIVIGIVAIYSFNSKNKIQRERFIAKREFLKYSTPLFLVTIVSYTFGWIDSFMIGYLLDNYNVGIYNAAFLVSQLLLLFPSIIFPLSLPIIGPYFARNEKKTVIIVSKQMAKWVLAFSFFVLLTLLAFPGTIIRIIFGQKYFPAIPALSILAVGFFISLLVPLFMVFLSLHKDTKLILFNSLITLIINIILNLVLIPKYGITGAAIATAISQIILVSLVIIENYKLYQINLFSFNLIKIALAIIVPTIVIFSFKIILGQNIPILSIIILISLIIYLIFLLKLKVIDNSDKEIVRDFIKKVNIKVPNFIFKLIEK